MNKSLVYISCVYLAVVPCYATDVNVSSDASALDFKTAVLLGNSVTISVDSGGNSLWLRAMKGNGEMPVAGTITFSSNMSDGYDTLIIQPTVTSSTEFPITGGSGCDLKITNLVFSNNAVTLTTSNRLTSVNVGASIKINGLCSAAYTYIGNISIPYKIMNAVHEELKNDMVTLPVKFAAEHNANMNNDTDMNFGTIVTDGTAGSVTMNTDGIITSRTGRVNPLGKSTAGQISIYGTEDMLINNVTYDETIYLHNGENTLTVDNFTLNQGRTFTLNERKNGQGYKMLKIGGTLHIEENKPAGRYSGTLNILISY